MGLLERGGEVRARVIENVRKKTLHGLIREGVSPGSEVLTDSLPSYRGLEPEYSHGVVDHSREYVRDYVHTNGIENFWALLKRAIKGTYVRVSRQHLWRYLDEQAFRFNYRRVDDLDRFVRAVAGVFGKRLTYQELIAA